MTSCVKSVQGRTAGRSVKQAPVARLIFSLSVYLEDDSRDAAAESALKTLVQCLHTGSGWAVKQRGREVALMTAGSAFTAVTSYFQTVYLELLRWLSCVHDV